MNLFLKCHCTTSLFIALILVIPLSITYTQEKTGNIVEYFGKEKINDISEGELVHVFDHGLILDFNAIDNRSSTFPQNPVFSKFLLDPEKTIRDGEIFGIDYLGEEMHWKLLQTDSTHTFRDRSLRSGYLYLEFNSPKDQILLFEGSGQTATLINGLPHEGDHYDFGWSLIPVKIKRGINTFVLSPGRFSRMRARLIKPENPLLLTSRDMTLPDILMEEEKEYVGGVRMVNALNENVTGYSIKATIKGKNSITSIPDIAPYQVIKIPFKIPYTKAESGISEDLKIELIDNGNKVISTISQPIQVRSNSKHHKRTFISKIDGSVQYFSVAPSTQPNQQGEALFLSVHGASVEAVNQANAYDQKDWGNLIAPTNRRPFGFAWEDWGRLDAMEVLDEATEIYQPDPQKIYLTGHSMGGHGTWYLGATYPDRFAAIAPCAGYPDLLEYRNSFIQRRLRNNPELLQRFGISEKTVERMLLEHAPTPLENLITRAGNPSRTLKLIRNYLQQGVYILHGEKDNVVPTYLAQDMRERLGKFHPDFTYYEYPDGTHWYGDHSVDWPPIFDFFKRRTIPKSNAIDQFEFFTASPSVSSKSHFIEILQQEIPFEISNIKVDRIDSLFIQTGNTSAFAIDAPVLGDSIGGIKVDGQTFEFSHKNRLYFKKSGNEWLLTKPLSKKEKGPHRSGGFKDAFNNNVVFVYATGGTKEENQWYFNRATFDAEKFWYRANGNIQLVKDTEFNPEDYSNRNVVLYGNRDNNAAWDKLLVECPIQISNDKVELDKVTISGTQWGTYFIYPRADNDQTSIGVVSASGMEGMKAAFANEYLENGTTYPDFLLFDYSVLTEGTSGVKCAGFFGNDWSVKNGDFEWK
ncbi:alpha/beta fold hydrolase [Membranihabitans maritimus]|uniref:carboxylesterase family protein n=1 Tax=Membranihabitans maritimus TaxID=2904244 RepID=UPI001F1910BE|nr:alpha/beta fold hydrolase [Membranihabitans maritimus]